MKKESGNTETFTTLDMNRILTSNIYDITLTPEGLAYLGVLPHQSMVMQTYPTRPAIKTDRLIKRAM